MNQNIKKQITELYNSFFLKNGIDFDTGVLEKQGKRFVCYPYIGSKYSKLPKILFIGLDVGKDDEKKIVSLETRKDNIGHPFLSKHNPHIAGTYFTALYFLKESNEEYIRYWNNLENNQKTCQMILKTEKPIYFYPEPANDNPLAYIALTNFYKYVTINRKNRSGNADRISINQAEEKLLLEEIDILDPEIIICQSQEFKSKREFFKSVNKQRIIYIGNHPSSRAKGIRIPKKLIKTYQCF